MSKTKTINIIHKFNNILESENPTQEEKEFYEVFELELAKGLLLDFGKDSAKILSDVLSSFS